MVDAALRALINKANKKYGEDTLVLASDILDAVPRMTTGSLSQDVALGGGWPANQWNEIIGLESHGKTVVALKTVAANQARDKKWFCVWVASEPFDKKWARTLGVDLTRVLIIDENGAEKVFQLVNEACATKAVDCIVIDSLPMLVAEREEEGTMDDIVVGGISKIAAQFFRTNRTAMKRSLTKAERPVLGIIINQWRDKIGAYGDPRTTPGGKAKNFSFYTRVDVRRDDWLKDGDDFVGQSLVFDCKKNKSFPPRRKGHVDFYFEDYGDFKAGDYDTFKEIVNLGVVSGVIPRSGNTYSWGEHKWVGRPKLIAGLGELSDAEREAIKTGVLQVLQHRIKPTPDDDEEPEPEDKPKSVKRKRKKSSAK